MQHGVGTRSGQGYGARLVPGAQRRRLGLGDHGARRRRARGTTDHPVRCGIPEVPSVQRWVHATTPYGSAPQVVVGRQPRAVSMWVVGGFQHRNGVGLLCPVTAGAVMPGQAVAECVLQPLPTVPSELRLAQHGACVVHGAPGLREPIPSDPAVRWVLQWAGSRGYSVISMTAYRRPRGGTGWAVVPPVTNKEVRYEVFLQKARRHTVHTTGIQLHLDPTAPHRRRRNIVCHDRCVLSAAESLWTWRGSILLRIALDDHSPASQTIHDVSTV